MGVYRLTRFVNEHPAARESFELKSGDVLVVDGSSFVFEVAQVALRDLLADVPTLHYLGGEYRTLHEYITQFATALTSRGLVLRVLFDPSVGGYSEDDWRHKLPVWEERFQERYTGVRMLERFCDRIVGSIDSQFQMFSHGALLIQVIESLRHAGVQCSIAKSEADVHLVHQMLQLGGKAVASNDSDFGVIAGSRWMPLEELLRLATVPADAPLETYVVTPASIARALELPESRVPEVAALCGCDSTKQILTQHKVLEHIGFEKLDSQKLSDPAQVARWLQTNARPDQPLAGVLRDRLEASSVPHAAVDEIMRAVAHSLQFYSAEAVAAAATPHAGFDAADPYVTYVLQRMETASITSAALSVVVASRHWTYPLPESLKRGVPPAADVLVSLRELLCGVLGRTKVTDYVRRATKDGTVRVEPRLLTPTVAPPFALPIAPEAPLPTAADVLAAVVRALAGSEADTHGALAATPGLHWLVALLHAVAVRARRLRAPVELWHCTALLRMALLMRRPQSAAEHAARVRAAARTLRGRRPDMMAVTLLGWVQSAFSQTISLAQVVGATGHVPEPREVFSGVLWLLCCDDALVPPLDAAERRILDQMHATLRKVVETKAVSAGPVLNPFEGLVGDDDDDEEEKEEGGGDGSRGGEASTDGPAKPADAMPSVAPVPVPVEPAPGDDDGFVTVTRQKPRSSGPARGGGAGRGRGRGGMGRGR